MEEFNFFDDLFEPILVEDQFGKIVYFNSALLSLFRLTPRYFKKNDESELFFAEHVPMYLSNLADFKKIKQTALSAEINFKLDGQVMTSIIKAFILADNYVFIFKDMTVEKQLYDKYKLQVEELKSSHSQILQSDKLKVIGEMTANVSHEINNPLTVAMGNSEMISFTLESDDLNKQKTEIEKFNNNISQSITRITKIVNNMKDFLHKSEDEKEYFSIKEIVEKASSFLTPLISQKNIKFNVNCSNLNPIVFVNVIKLEQVFVNLIQNAIDSMVDSSTKNPTINISISTSNIEGYITIDVIDNGIGVKEENRDKIFQTFFTTKELGKGTGLGLSISARIIESHQGRLELVDSKIGAQFRIVLPSVSISSYVSGDWEKMHSTDNNFKKVLIVDNEPSILNLCMNFMRNSDFYFIGATSAEEAIAQISRIPVDLIITDFKMPNMNGEDFVRVLRSKNIMTPVFYMTAKDSVEKFIESKVELNLTGMIIKPFTKEELISTIEAAFYDKK